MKQCSNKLCEIEDEDAIDVLKIILEHNIQVEDFDNKTLNIERIRETFWLCPRCAEENQGDMSFLDITDLIGEIETLRVVTSVDPNGPARME